ncbi:MAG: D-alanine--D-alanine ligase [Bacteroidales bacterium]|nr:D-alanine--D-alanine ligase [Bacteroidales bacterium]
MPDKKNIAVLAGGNSSEFFISLKSSENIAKEIDKEKYNVYIVQIKGKEWTLINDLNCGLIIHKNDFSFTDRGQKETFDIVVSVIHGTPGEDGLLQAYFDMLSIPYIGSGVLASALTFNKFYCNTFLKNFNIVNIADSVLLRKNQTYNSQNIIVKLGLPCFVKPNAGGSSFGVTKVKKEEDLETAVENAFKESDEVIIEKFIEGDEIQCGIFKTKEKEYILPLVEIVPKNEFFDYQAKYDGGFSDEIIPARISDELTKKCRNITSEIYDALHCKGIVRMDFILKNNEFWFLEANTIPGMTDESLVPQMIQKAGMTVKEVFTLLIEDALKK